MVMLVLLSKDQIKCSLKPFPFLCHFFPTGLGGPVSGDCPHRQRLKPQEGAWDDGLRLATPLVLRRKITHTPLPLILSSFCFYGYQEDSARPCVWLKTDSSGRERNCKVGVGWLTACLLFYNLFTTECIYCNTCLLLLLFFLRCFISVTCKKKKPRQVKN